MIAPPPPNSAPDGALVLRMAQSAADLRAAQHLRYLVFVQELGAHGPMIDHDAQLEIDHFDDMFDHMLLIDPSRSQNGRDFVVGVYRLLRGAALAKDARFYSEDEFDLAPLRRTGRALLELGRSCVHPDYRGGPAMLQLWNGLADYVQTHGIELMFGPASFHGTDLAALAQPLSYLHHHHLAPPPYRVQARPPHGVDMARVPPAALNTAAALAGIPSLIKAYLRLGGYVGQGAWVDHAFNTTDVCLVMDTATMSARHRDFYTRKRQGGDGRGV
jgi:L-ornithine Nalpha-acyltransferase